MLIFFAGRPQHPRLKTTAAPKTGLARTARAVVKPVSVVMDQPIVVMAACPTVMQRPSVVCLVYQHAEILYSLNMHANCTKDNILQLALPLVTCRISPLDSP